MTFLFKDMPDKSSINVSKGDRLLLRQHSKGLSLTRLVSALIHAYVENPNIIERQLEAASRSKKEPVVMLRPNQRTA